MCLFLKINKVIGIIGGYRPLTFVDIYFEPKCLSFKRQTRLVVTGRQT